MSMSTYVVGVRNLDGEFAKMIRVKKACDEAGVGYPPEVKSYFKYPNENEEYLRQEMEEIILKDAVIKRNFEMQEIFEVDLSKLPKEVKAIRFINSY